MNSESDKFVTIATFDDLANASILKARLEASGIEAILADQHLVTINPLFSFAVGGIKLKVRERDMLVAEDILADVSTDSEPEMQPIELDEPPDDFSEPPYPYPTPRDVTGSGEVSCLKCSSPNVVQTNPSSFLSLLARMFLPLPVKERSDEWECRNCGYRWSDDDEEEE